MTGRGPAGIGGVSRGFGTGPRHTRGTPPNAVEMTPETFVGLAVGRLRWPEAALNASGVHAGEASRAFPLSVTSHGCGAPAPTA